MRWFEILLIFILLTLAEGTNSSQLPNWQSSWITGGLIAPRARYIYMVSLRTTQDDKHFCGGTIVSHWYILTAAHCVDGRPPSSIIAVVATAKLGKSGRRYGVVSYETHQGYNPTTLKNDIALIKVNSAIKFSPTTNTAPLPQQDEITAPGTFCTFMGWGKTAPSATSYARDLRLLKLKIIPMLRCLQSYLHVSVTYICADAGPGKGANEGDEGGPLICNGKQIGLYSGERTPGPGFTPPHATLFVSVSKFVNWIQRRIAV